MKTIISFLLILFTLHAQAQGRHSGRNGHSVRNQRAVMVHRSAYRPAKVIIYHPVWAPGMNCHRRWIYFPYRNMYWDNWRNHYVFYNGTTWVSQASLPVGVTEKELSQEKSKELKKDEDDLDEVYVNNVVHKE